MAVIQFQKQDVAKDSVVIVSWPGLAFHAASGNNVTVTGNSLLTWNSGAHGMNAGNVGCVMWMSPTGGTAGLYQMASYISATQATFTAVGFSATNVAGVTCAWSDVGSPYSQPDAALDRTLQVHGTFGAAGSLSLYGSIDLINYAICKDNTGTVLTCTTTTCRNVFDGPYAYVPMVTAGDGTTSLTAMMLTRIQLPRAIL